MTGHRTHLDPGDVHVRWPEPLRAVVGRTARALREIAVGIDTWSAVTHGVIPLDDRVGGPPRHRPPTPPPPPRT